MILREAGRYLVAGGVNTALTYLVYLGLLRVLDFRLAYVLAFIAGIGLSYLLLRHLVFARRGRSYSQAYVAASHVLQLILGLAVVEAWVNWLGLAAWSAPLAAIAVCLPVMFLLQRWIFTPHAAQR